MNDDLEFLRSTQHVLPEGTRMRTGRSVGRTIYLQRTDDPSRADLLIGMVDTPALADLIVRAVNRLVDEESGGL